MSNRIPWPTKNGPLEDVGLESHGPEGPIVKDCVMCPLDGVCPGYQPLNPSAAPPPCETYTDYTEWEESIKINGGM